MIFSKDMSEIYWRLPCASVLFALINTILTQGVIGCSIMLVERFDISKISMED